MPDSQRILSGATDKTVRVCRIDGTLQNTFYLHNDTVKALVAMPDNQHALSASDDKTVKLFNVNDGAVLRNFTPHNLGDLPGAAARRPPLRQRLVGHDRPHRLPASRAEADVNL